MPAKNKIRSFRFSDEVAAILEGYEGKNLNDKFENLVRFCYYKVEQRQKELEHINQRIKERTDQLYDLHRQTQQLDLLHKDLDAIKRNMEMAGRRAKNMADGILP